jgi:hypothetical protein
MPPVCHSQPVIVYHIPWLPYNSQFYITYPNHSPLDGRKYCRSTCKTVDVCIANICIILVRGRALLSTQPCLVQLCLRLEFIMTMKVSVVVFCIATLCSLASCYQLRTEPLLTTSNP